ncbi:MAG: aldolase/citrate lyase family protein [Aminivibrio sp.]|uniref:HpcH/HpaI aldolase/citrate lyase family protein n=1 Tax=Aminivibrio sp. TaxID=1872489 RepID=UPI002B1F0984|nr:aldolase/citrate lyase family protein [Aminivibrio sp.]MEA4953546.1 aldolase/citrate lyase family protein [Aminivibrio sp.]
MNRRRLRRTSLYIPGTNPGMLANAEVYGADSVILDLEDGVPVSEKDAARILVRNALQHIPYRRAEVTVRVNALSTPFGRDDFREIIPLAPDAVRLPKCESADDVREADAMMTEIELENGIEPGTVGIIAITESARGGRNLSEIAAESPRLIALNYGAEDYTADIGAVRTKEGRELDDIRAKVIVAARIAGVQALDSVFGDVNDLDGLYAEALRVRLLGFDGKSVIHPRQIPVVHRAFTPSDQEVGFARRVMAAFREASSRGAGVIALDGRMIDAPVVARAEKILALAEAAGCIPGER